MNYANGWFFPTAQTADIYSKCDTSNWVSVPENQLGWDINFQYPKDGNSMAGLYYYFQWPIIGGSGFYSLRDYMGTQ